MTIPEYNGNLCQSTLFKGYSGCQCEYCCSYRELPGQWKVDIKGNRMHDYEICLVRENNRHGLASWGWYDENKQVIAVGNHGQQQVSLEVWKELVSLAHKICARLNKQGNR